MVTPNCDCHRTTMWRTRSSTAQQSSPPLDMGLIAGVYFHLGLILMALFDKILETEKKIKWKEGFERLSSGLLQPWIAQINQLMKMTLRSCFSDYLHPSSFLCLAPFFEPNFFVPVCCHFFSWLHHLAAWAARLNMIRDVHAAFTNSVLPRGWKTNQGYFISPFFSFSSQREEDGERRRKQKTFDFGQAELPRYTAMDAVGLVGLLLISPGNCHVFPNLTEISMWKFFKG